METRQFVIAGAGPVGLSLALGLARKGHDVLVLEKESTTAEHSRAPAIWPRTQEVLARLEVIDTFLAEGIVMDRLAPWDVEAETFVFSAPLHELAGQTPYPHLLIMPQSRTEKLLLDAVQPMPSAEVRFSCEVLAVTRNEDVVEVSYRGAGGEDRAVRGRFLVGCDGAHSTVRDAIGAGLDGITYDMRAALADVRLGPADLHSPRLTARPEIAIGIRIGADLWRLILPLGRDDGTDLDRRVEQAVERLFPSIPWQPVWQSTFRLHRRLATTFAVGRVVLAGDAAHLNSPVGGQGMNAGIQDAGLLVEALDEASRQDDPAPLARFGRQRREQISRGVNRVTDALTRVLLFRNGRYLPWAFRGLGLALRVPPVRRRILRRMAMLD